MSIFIKSTRLTLPFQNLEYQSEINKLAILRIITGLIIFHRYATNLDASVYFSFPVSDQILLVITLVFVTAFTIGFLTPLALIICNIMVVVVDKHLGIYNLGTAVFSNVILILLLSQSGRSYSLDARVIKSSELIKNLYFQEFMNSEVLRWVYVYGILIFSLVNLASVVGHLLDPFWLNGTILEATFLNPFYSKYYDHISVISFSFPQLFQLVCFIGIALHVIWQIFMFPMIFTQAGRLYVVGWGIVFFLLSFFLLQLSYLSYYLFVLWSALFFSPSELKTLFPGAGIRFSLNGLPKGAKIISILIVPFIVVFLMASILTALAIFQNKHDAARSNTEASTFNVLKLELPWAVHRAYDLSALVGLITPNVFNSPDVKAAKKYVFIEKSLDLGENWTIVPFIGKHGERLSYHSNDILYYGYSIPLRRCIQFRKLVDCQGYISTLVKYDQKRTEEKDAIYRYTYVDDYEAVKVRHLWKNE